jgi:O-antigen/teichoic acid export membrane protein
MSALKNLAKETVIYGMSHVLPRILHFGVMTIYLTHRFEDQVDYGIYSELYAYATILLALMVFRMDTAYFRFGSQREDKGEVFATVILPVVVIAFLFSGIMVLGAERIAAMLDYPNQAYYVKWFAWILGLDALTSIVYAKFRLESRPLRFLFFRVANVLITVIFVLFFLEIIPAFNADIIPLWMNSLGLRRELDFVFLSNLIASITVAILMIPEVFKINLKLDTRLLRKAVAYSWPLVLVALAASINQSSPMILQKYWLSGTVEENQAWVGIYSAGAKLAILLNLFTTAFNYAAEPFFFNNAAKKNDKSIYGDVALAYTIFASVTVLGTYLFIDVVMQLIGESYQGGIVVVPILLMAFVFLGLYYMVAIWYKLSNNTRIGALVSGIGVLVTLVSNYFLLPVVGIVGSAWGALACYSIMVYVCYQWGKKYYPIAYPWQRIIRVIFVTAIVVFASHQIRDILENTPRFIYLINTIFFIVSIGSLWFMEKSFIFSVFKR